MEKTPTELLIKTLPKTVKVALGTVSGMLATALVHPLDVIKVRMQIREKKMYTLDVARMIVKCEGFRALYAGLSAGLMRQATYTTTRLTTYHLLNEYYKRKYNVAHTSSLGIQDKVVIGVYAGMAGAIMGNPSEVALVRMMADGPRLCCPMAVTHRRRYRGVMHAFYKIARDDGILALWRGSTLTLGRSILVSIAQIGTYAQVNEFLRQNKILNGYYAAHIVTSMASSLVTTLVSLPIDLVKTRYQVRNDKMTQREILNDILKRKGVGYLWKGVGPYFVRMTIHTIGSLLFFEYLAETFFRKEKVKT